MKLKAVLLVWALAMVFGCRRCGFCHSRVMRKRKARIGGKTVARIGGDARDTKQAGRQEGP